MSQETFGRYILKGTLGRGAMGMVYLALDPILDRLSAIKVMNTGGEVDEGLRTRFFREAKSAARLRHPNIIAIYEMGEEGKRPFIAMEYVEGQDLKALIEKRTFIPFEQKIRILVQVCEALSYAHQQGVIHRDIKPANVRIAQDGEVRILDFGLARLGSSDITRTGMLMGTPYYMSPEQVRGVRDLDGRSDLFSVAVLFYELLTYSRPFEAESSTEVCLKIVSEPHTPVASVLPKVDADLAAIIDRALSKNRDARQHDCQELARALKEYALTIPQRLKGLEAEVARLEREWKSCCDASQHLVQLGILEESLLAPPRPSPAPSIDPEETTVYNFSLEASQRDFGALLLMHAHLHGRLEEVRQRLRAAVPLQELFERGRQQHKQGEFEGCLKTLTEILEMVPQNARALEMQSECLRLLEERRVEQERRTGLKQALALASEALEQGNLAQCIQSSSRALQIDPGNSQAQELKQQASEALVRRRKVAELLAAARGFHKTQNYESACQVCAEALALDPTHAEVRLIQQQAQQILERQSQIQEWLNQAQEQLRAGDYLAVLGITDQLLTLEPDLPRALEMQQQAAEALEQQLKLEELLAVARDCEMSGDFEKCLRVCDEVLSLEPKHREVLTLQRQAAEGLETQQHFEELLVLARDHSKSQNHADCLKAADEALAFKPEHPELRKLREKAAAALDHQRRIRELLEEAQEHERAGELELALEKARAGLQLEAHNTQFLSIQSRTTAALEHQQRVSALLSEARQQLNNHRYEASLRSAEELLKLEGAHPEGLDLKQAAASALERLRKLNQSLAQAKAKSGLWEECLQAATEGLRLDPAHAELRELASQASEILDKRRTLQELLDSGRGQLGRGEHEAALKSAERALQLGPDNAEAVQLKQQAQSALDLRRKKEQVAGLLAEARKHEQSGDMEACYRAASEGLTLEPEHVDLKALRENSGRILEIRRQVQILLESARQQWEAGDFSRVMETAVSVLQLDPENAKAADFKLKAEQERDRRQRLKELLSQASRADKERDHEACLQAAEEGLVLDSGHPELLQLQSHSRQMLEQIRRMAQLLHDARAEIEAQNYATALKTLDSALKLESANAEAAQLKQKAQEAWELQKRLAVLLNDAQRHLKAGHFEACLESAGQGLALEADHPPFKELTLEAQRQLELRSRIEEGLKRGSQHLERKEYQPAVAAYDSVLTLAPGQVKAVEGRQRAHEALQRQQRLKECLARAKAAFDAKDFESCHAATEEGLGLEPAHSALQDLAKKATQIIERTRRVQQFWNEASQNQQKGDLPGCLHSLDSLLELDPENAATQELRPRVVEALERQRRTTGLLAEAASLEKSGDFEACQRLAEQALQIDPKHSQAEQFHQRVSLALERRRQIEKFLKQAARRFEEQDDAGALKVLEELLRLDPAHPGGLQIQSLASKRLEHRKQMEQLLVQARKAQEAHDPEKCLQAAEQALQLEPAHVEFKKLQAQSREQLARQRKIRELVSECQKELDAGALEASIASAQRLESLDPGNTIAAETRQKANEGLELRRRLLSLLTRARELIAAGDFAAGHTMCSEALEFDPSNTELLALREKAFKVLESRRREEERQRRMQQLLASAKASLQGSRFRAAQRDLTVLLELDGAHIEARRLLAETEAQRTLARQKNYRLAKIAAAAVLVVSALGSGLWVLKQKPASPPPASVSGPNVATPPPEPSAPPPQPSAQEQEIARMVSTSNDFLRDRKYSEAEKAAEELLSRVPGHSEGTRIKAEARKNLTEIDQGLKRARALLNSKQYQEVVSVLDAVLKLDPAQGEALHMGSQLDRYLQKNAEDARRQMQRLKSRAEQSKASALVQGQYQIASLLENDALKLMQEKKFGAATGKFYQAKDAYLKAEGEARAKSEASVVKPVSEKPAAPSPGVADPPPNPVDHQKEEGEKQQLALLKGQAQDASANYMKALARASQASAERLAPEAFQPATNLATRAQDKFNQGNYAGAQSDFGEALRQMENAIVRAEEVARLRRLDDERKQKERLLAEQVAAQNHPAPPPPQIGGSGQKADDRQLVLQVLRRYEVAMNHKSIKEMKEVWSLAKEEEKRIDESFKFAKSMQVHLENSTEPRISGDTAIVNCRRIVQITTPDGKQRRNDSNVTVTLRKKGGNWIIETMQ